VIVVFDSGVWISALHFAGTPMAALDRVFLIDQLAVCDKIVMEIRTALEKLQWETNEVQTVLEEYLSDALNIRVTGALAGVCRDPKDDMVLECAVNADAQLVVSGDNDLLAVKVFRNIRMASPRMYLDEPIPQ
jgi:uncharacterized protein